MATDLQFRSKNSEITGILGAQLIHCTIQPANQTGYPPSGVYRILLRSNDPFYGTVALLVPAAGSSPGAPSAQWTWIEGGAPKTGITATWVQGGMPPKAMWWISNYDQVGRLGNSSKVFVLSDKRIPGRNNLVVTSGFPKLLAALQSADAASITIS